MEDKFIERLELERVNEMIPILFDEDYVLLCEGVRISRDNYNRLKDGMEVNL